MNDYKPLDALIMGALPLPVFAGPPPVALGPIFNPPSRPAPTATANGLGAGIAVVPTDPCVIR